MEIHIKDTSLTDLSKEKESMFQLWMDQHIKEAGKKTRNMERENKCRKVDSTMKVTGSIQKEMDLEFNIKMRRISTKDIGKMTRNKEKESFCKMATDMKVISKRESNIHHSLR